MLSPAPQALSTIRAEGKTERIVLLKEFVKSIPRELTSPFRSVKGFNKTLLVAFIILNSIVVLNACLHDPSVGYDGHEHLKYIEALAKMRLPTSTETIEFFSPPLPYVMPAFVLATGAKDFWWPAKVGQLVNALLSIALTFYLLKLCDFLSLAPHLKTAALLFLGLLPVYYKSFAFVRGEPLVAFLAVFIIHQALIIFVSRRWAWWNVIVLGVAMGLLVLSRQWGFLLFPALMVWVAWLAFTDRKARSHCLKALLTALAISFVVGGWFYLGLLKRYGVVTAFNRQPAPAFSLANQPARFYLGLGADEAGAAKLFTDPVRSAFPNQLLPIFYSEVWGDYWQYFVVSGFDSRTGEAISGGELEGLLSQKPPLAWLVTNRFRINSYLGRVNLVSLLPTALALLAIFFCVMQWIRDMRRGENTERARAFGLVILCLVTSVAGYLWFLIMYPNAGKGDTIKATYLLHAFPLVALMVAMLLAVIRERKRLVYQLVMLLLIAVWLHNLPAMVTHYISWPGLHVLSR